MVLTRQEIIAKNDAGDYQVTEKGRHTHRRVSTVVELRKDLDAELDPVVGAENASEARNGHLEKQAGRGVANRARQCLTRPAM